jgi:integrase
VNRRIRRDLKRFGLPMLQITSPAVNARVVQKHAALIDGLIEDSQVGVLRALMEKRVTLDQLVEAKRHNELNGAAVLTSIAIREPLWKAMDNALPKMGKAKVTRTRYEQAKRNLERKGTKYLTPTSTVAELLTVDWNALQSEWGNSGSDWMHLRRFISAFLTKHLGDVYHPFRRQVMPLIPTAEEVEREPDITPELFWTIIEKAREDVRAAYVTIVLTGMRRSEYLRCTRDNLMPAILAVQVPGRKTKRSKGTVMVNEDFWPWVEAGIVSPVRYKRLRELWIEACTAAGVSDLKLHDLRHALGQWATNEGVPESKIQSALRHASISTTRRYTRQKAKGEVAAAVGRALNTRSRPERKQTPVNSMSLVTEKQA